MSTDDLPKKYKEIYGILSMLYGESDWYYRNLHTHEPELFKALLDRGIADCIRTAYTLSSFSVLKED